MPEPPVEGVPLDVSFTSPAAKAQLSSKAANIMQFLNDVSAYRAIDPSITDGIDTASLGQELATLREAPKRILKSQEQIQQTKQDRDQIAAQTANAQNAAALAGALKDTAAAQARVRDDKLLQHWRRNSLKTKTNSELTKAVFDTSDGRACCLFGLNLRVLLTM